MIDSFRKKIRSCVYMMSFLFLEIFFALNSNLSAISSAIPAFFWISIFMKCHSRFFYFHFFKYNFDVSVACKSGIFNICLDCVFKSSLIISAFKQAMFIVIVSTGIFGQFLLF